MYNEKESQRANAVLCAINMFWWTHHPVGVHDGVLDSGPSGEYRTRLVILLRTWKIEFGIEARCQ